MKRDWPFMVAVIVMVIVSWLWIGVIKVAP